MWVEFWGTNEGVARDFRAQRKIRHWNSKILYDKYKPEVGLIILKSTELGEQIAISKGLVHKQY
mgnify:CR=1 FL=1